jgi:ribonuclease BN (tRNA processing enzyme)
MGVDAAAGLRVVFLGTGDAFSLERAGAGLAVQYPSGEVLLLDTSAGPDVLRRLRSAGIGADRVGAVVLSHQHYDHAGGLFAVLLHTMRRERPLDVYCPEGAVAPLQEALRALLPFVPAVMGERLRWHGCRDGQAVAVAQDAARLGFVAVEHGEVGALGVVLQAGARRLVYSGDTRPSAALTRAAQGADVLVHDALNLEADVGPTTARPASLHSTAADAGRLAAAAGVRRLFLTHVGDATTERCGRLVAEARRYFDGPVEVAADLREFVL